MAEAVATVEITALAAGGDGVARIDGLACFVPRTAPGDVVQIAYTSHARYARGRVLQVVTPSPDRVTPPCVHFERDRCGGCQWQHLSEPAQQEARRRIVQDALARVGQRRVAMPELIAGPSWGYRGRLTVSLTRKGRGYMGGLHPFDAPGQVFQLESCAICDPALMACWEALRGTLRDLPDAPPSEPLRLALRRIPESADHVGVVLHGGRVWPAAAAWADQVMASAPMVRTLWWEPAGASPVWLAGADDVRVLAFAQVNAGMARQVHAHVLDCVRASAPASVIDAYCGTGALAEALAADQCRVIAIEADASATHIAADRLRGFPQAEVHTALVEDVLPGLLPADCVILNPPRRGVDVRVAAALDAAASAGVRAIVYVSCDPATLARDLRRMPRWQVASVACFDMFPQTAHVETVCVLYPEPQ